MTAIAAPQATSVAPLALARRLWRYRELVFQLAKREVLLRYSGSAFGLLWSFAQPLLLLAVYTFAFRELLGLRWPGSDSRADFAVLVFCGMIVHGLFAEMISRAPVLVLSCPNYVKKVVFPLHVLPAASLVAALFHFAISLFVLLLFAFAAGGGLPATVLLVPVVLAPFVLLVLGMSWFLASLGVYFRDIHQVTGIVATVMMFLSPVFYPASAVGPRYRAILELNPLTPIIESLRDVLVLGVLPDFASLAAYTLFAAVLAWTGYAWFESTRDGFADVI
jgi:lipopolysaccharide transport system permease protein